jgi:hypothetical protein
MCVGLPLLQVLTGRQAMAMVCHCSKLPKQHTCSSLRMQMQQQLQKQTAAAAAGLSQQTTLAAVLSGAACSYQMQM